MPDFLLEIGLEEIPARMLDRGAEELARRVGELLVKERLADTATVESFATPRRLAVLAPKVRATQPDVEEQVTGPSVKVAFKDGKPTAAAEAFAKKVGLAVGKLERTTTSKGEYLTARVTQKGRAAGSVLAETLPREVLALHWAKNMYWREEKPERFVRPVRWVVALLDGEVIPLELAGVRAGKSSQGHRTLSNGAVGIASPSAYADALEKAGVVVARSAREQRIRKALDAAARTVAGARWREDAELLSTVVNLTEFPSAILGGFDKEFLALPEEVLVTVMRDHQKYFALETAEGKLAPHFLAVLNTDGDTDGTIRHGHERVLRARFSDARFFWESDQKIPLKQRVEMLKAVTFHKDLGSYYEKAERVAKLADQLAADVANQGVKVDRNAVHEAAWLAKTDLTTELVKEFTELQGVVGGLYARAQGLDGAVADAIYDHYKPESADDPAPRTVEGAVLSIADKADTIAGMFALGLQPTGSKDPFALRRQANGIVRTLAEHKLSLSLSTVFSAAVPREILHRGERARPQSTGGSLTAAADSVDIKIGMPAMPTPEYLQEVTRFLRERVEFYLRDNLGFRYDEVNAVLAASTDDVPDIVERARAVAAMRGSADFEAISIAFKRMKNILQQAREAKIAPAAEVASEKLAEPAEKELAGKLPALVSAVAGYRDKRNYAEALRQIAGLRPLVDRFFDTVMVMVEDAELRANRLALLGRLTQECSTIADFSEIVTEGKN